MPESTTAARLPDRFALLDRRSRARVRALRALQIALGRDLLELRRADVFLMLGTTSFPQYCEAIGLSTIEGRELTALAEASETRPDVEAKVAEAKISVQKGATVAEVVLNPALAGAGSPDGKPGGDVVGAWLVKAERTSSRELRDLLRRRREEVRLRSPAVEVRLWVSGRGLDDFGRCRTLLSRREQAWLTEGQAFEALCRDFLWRHDPEVRGERALGSRRGGKPPAPGTRGGPPNRRVPARVRHEILATDGDRCLVEGCDRKAFLDLAHHVPFREGGPQEVGNLYRFCRGHHRQHDDGKWRIVKQESGEILLINRQGETVGRMRTPQAPEQAEGPAEGEARASEPRPPPGGG